QQWERKRFIGNDIVVIVFYEGKVHSHPPTCRVRVRVRWSVCGTKCDPQCRNRWTPTSSCRTSTTCSPSSSPRSGTAPPTTRTPLPPFRFLSFSLSLSGTDVVCRVVSCRQSLKAAHGLQG